MNIYVTFDIVKHKAENLQQRIRIKVVENGYRSLADFCRLNSVSRTSLHYWFKAGRLPQKRTVDKLCRLLGSTAGELGFYGYDDKSTSPDITHKQLDGTSMKFFNCSICRQYRPLKNRKKCTVCKERICLECYITDDKKKVICMTCSYRGNLKISGYQP